MGLRSRWRLILCVTLCAGTNALAQFDDLEVTLTPVAQEYCHIIRFPQAWAMPRTDPKTGELLHLGAGFGSVTGELEFRIEGLQGTQFLVGGFSQYFPEYDLHLETTNRFIVDLSNSSVPIGVATKAAWDAATVVPTTRRGPIWPGYPPQDKPIAVNGLQFAKSGELWGLDPVRLSLDQAWVVLQSEALLSSKGATSIIYFDVFSAETGGKIVTIQGTFSSDAGEPSEDVLSRTGWVTERYFIVPLGKRIDRLLVCEFGKQGKRGSEEHRKK